MHIASFSLGSSTLAHIEARVAWVRYGTLLAEKGLLGPCKPRSECRIRGKRSYFCSPTDDPLTKRQLEPHVCLLCRSLQHAQPDLGHRFIIDSSLTSSASRGEQQPSPEQSEAFTSKIPFPQPDHLYSCSPSSVGL